MKSVVLIPARMESNRFPGKPLAQILGKPMIQYVFDAAEASEASDSFVVTDSQEIMDAVESFGGAAILTSDQPQNGTERCLEALEIIDPQGSIYDVVINVQGDEPLIQSSDINALLALFQEDEVDIATLIKAIDKEEDYLNPHIVKAVPTLFEDEYCDISYFSRSPIPYMKNFKEGYAFQHIGVYAFTSTALEEIRGLESSPLEDVEGLEQLRWLQNHLLISGSITETTLIGVDNPEDISAVENILTSKS
ncbi:MAG: 3-deoxy-manno-octulosonate cytidylyltransferase [Bacteroidia bacterium]